jgi:hypothetical protein
MKRRSLFKSLLALLAAPIQSLPAKEFPVERRLRANWSVEAEQDLTRLHQMFATGFHELPISNESNSTDHSSTTHPILL